MKTDYWAAIRYRELWDVPRIFLTEHRGRLFLFDCPFDEEDEDYPQFYRVYVLPALSEGELTGSWAKLHEKALQFLGETPIDTVVFQSDDFQKIDAGLLDRLTAQKALAS